MTELTSYQQFQLDKYGDVLPEYIGIYPLDLEEENQPEVRTIQHINDA